MNRRGSKPPAPLPPEPIYENTGFRACDFDVPLSSQSIMKKRLPPKQPQPLPEPDIPVKRQNSYGKKKPAPLIPMVDNKLEAANQAPKLNPVKEMQNIGKNHGVEVRFLTKVHFFFFAFSLVTPHMSNLYTSRYYSPSIIT